MGEGEGDADRGPRGESLREKDGTQVLFLGLCA